MKYSHLYLPQDYISKNITFFYSLRITEASTKSYKTSFTSHTPNNVDPKNYRTAPYILLNTYNNFWITIRSPLIYTNIAIIECSTTPELSTPLHYFLCIHFFFISIFCLFTPVNFEVLKFQLLLPYSISA